MQAGWEGPGGRSPSLADASRLGYTGPAPDSNAVTFSYEWTYVSETAKGYDPYTSGLELNQSKH